MDDIISDNIKVYNLPRLYPAVLAKSALTIPERVLYHFVRWSIPFVSRGTIYDRALFWRAQFLHMASSLIKTHDIKNVIATGAPFRLLYYSALLKDRFSDINIICDYRDPWIEPGGGYGVSGLNERKLSQEKSFEEKVYRNSDFIIAPSNHMIMPYKYGLDISSKVKIITHVYDPDDIPERNSINRSAEEIKLIYAGNIYPGLEDILQELRNALVRLRCSNRRLYNKLRLDFYTPDTQFSSLFNGDLKEIVSFHDVVSKDRIFAKLEESDICLLLLTKGRIHFRSTKFFEMLAMQKPLLLLGPDGEVAQFIEDNQIGYCITPERIQSEFSNFVLDYERGVVTYNGSFDQRQYSLDTVTDKLKALLI